MASTNSTNLNNEHLYGSTHGGSDNMPFLPEGSRCCQYRTFIFHSKNPGEVIFGHTPDCNIPQSLLDYGHAQLFAVYRNGPFEDSYPVMETISNPPILRGRPKWADDGKPILWYVDLKEKDIKGLLHPLAGQKCDKEKKEKGAANSDDKKEGKTDDSEKTYVDKAIQTDGKQVTVENENQGHGDEKKPHHTKVHNADGEDVTGSGSRPRRMTRGEDELRPQLQSLRICPDHGEENCEMDDPDYYDRQQRLSELDHLAMDSAATLVARPPQSYDPSSPRESRHHMRSYLRPLNASNYRPPRVELHQENHGSNASAAEQTWGLRGGPLFTEADDISDDGKTICRCVKYMVREYGQPLESLPIRYQVICERHDPNLQSRQVQKRWAEKDMEFMGLRGGAGPDKRSNAEKANAAEESHKREVSMEYDKMGFGDYAPVTAAVYENQPKDTPEQPSAPDAPTSTEKATGSGKGLSTSMGLRGGGMDGCDQRSETSEDAWRTESTSLSELFDRAKEIKTTFENNGRKTGRPQPAEGKNRLRVTSFIEALQNQFGEARRSSSTDCVSCVNITNKRSGRGEEQALRNTIKEMQRETNRMGIRSAKIAVEKGEVEWRKEKVMMKERALDEQKMLLDAAQDSFKWGLPTRDGATRDLRTEDLQHNTRTSRIQPTSNSNRSARQKELTTETISHDKLDMLLQVLHDWKQGSARLQKDVDDLNDELSTERDRRDTSTDKWIYSEKQAVRLEKENTELRRQLQIRDQSTRQRINLHEQVHPLAIYGPPTDWVPDSTNQQCTYMRLSAGNSSTPFGGKR